MKTQIQTMKKTILLAFTLLALGLNAQNVTIPDSNFKQQLINQSGGDLIDTNGDDEIQVSEAIAYSGGIYCSNLSITDLTGIEAFINITTLDCGFNSLTSIDLKSNTALTKLQCEYNSLTSLNIDSNTALTFLKCEYNSLTSLNLSNNTALVTLYCRNNDLTSLDVSGLIYLLRLGCNSNEISSLDLSVIYSVRYLWCLDNDMTFLNVANGANTFYNSFNATYNPDLCIQVDSVEYSETNWPNIDATASYSKLCTTNPNPTAINNLSFKTLKVFPNPTTGIVNISVNETLQSIVLLDITGKQIKSFDSKATQLDVTNVVTGIYFLEVANLNKKSVIKLVVR